MVVEIELSKKTKYEKLEYILSQVQAHFIEQEAGFGVASHLLKDQTERYVEECNLTKKSLKNLFPYCDALSNHTQEISYLYQDIKNNELDKNSNIPLSTNCEAEMLEGVICIFQQFVKILAEKPMKKKKEEEKEEEEKKEEKAEKAEKDTVLTKFLNEFDCPTIKENIKDNVKLVLEGFCGSKLALSVLPAYLTMAFNTYRAKFGQENVNEFQSLLILLKEESFST